MKIAILFLILTSLVLSEEPRYTATQQGFHSAVITTQPLFFVLEHTFEPAHTIVFHGDTGTPTITIDAKTGKVTLGSNVKPDEAARVFWRTVELARVYSTWRLLGRGQVVCPRCKGHGRVALDEQSKKEWEPHE